MLFDSAQDSTNVLAISRQMAGRLDSFFESLPNECRELQEVWTAPENTLGEGRHNQTSSQGKFSLDLIVDTAHVLLEYTVRNPFGPCGAVSYTDLSAWLDHVRSLFEGDLHEYERGCGRARSGDEPRYVLPVSLRAFVLC
jgi:hypothetical protein